MNPRSKASSSVAPLERVTSCPWMNVLASSATPRPVARFLETNRSKKLRYFYVFLRFGYIFDNVLIPPARPSSEDAFTSFVISEIDVTGKIDPNKLPGKWKEAGFTCKLIEADSEDLNEFS